MKEEIVVYTLFNRDWVLKRVEIVKETKKIVHVKFTGGLWPVEKNFRLSKELLEMGVHRFITKQEAFYLLSEMNPKIQKAMKKKPEIGIKELRKCGYL